MYKRQLIGDPPNILGGSALELSFTDFLFHLTPVVLTIMAAVVGMFVYFWKDSLTTSLKNRALVMNINEKDAITDFKLLKKALWVLGMVMAAFVVAHDIGSVSYTHLAIGLLQQRYQALQFRARGGGGKHGFGIGEFELVGRRLQIQRTAIGFYGVAGPAAFKERLRFQFPEIRVLGFGGKQAVQIFLGGVKVFLPHIICLLYTSVSGVGEFASVFIFRLPFYEFRDAGNGG